MQAAMCMIDWNAIMKIKERNPVNGVDKIQLWRLSDPA
jgi:hypothetical protein